MNTLSSAPSPLNNVALRKTALATTLTRRARLDSTREAARPTRRGNLTHTAPVQVIENGTLEKLWNARGLTAAEADRILNPETAELSAASDLRGNVRRLQYETFGLCVTLVSIVATFATLMLA